MEEPLTALRHCLVKVLCNLDQSLMGIRLHLAILGRISRLSNFLATIRPITNLFTVATSIVVWQELYSHSPTGMLELDMREMNLRINHSTMV
jgi:hypothetical protein